MSSFTFFIFAKIRPVQAKEKAHGYRRNFADFPKRKEIREALQTLESIHMMRK